MKCEGVGSVVVVGSSALLRVVHVHVVFVSFMPVLLAYVVCPCLSALRAVARSNRGRDWVMVEGEVVIIVVAGSPVVRFLHSSSIVVLCCHNRTKTNK
jgi:hypothetical protein